MDRLIYTAASGAKHILEQQATTSNNLANLGTTGFRAQLDTFRAVPVQGEGLPTRAFVVDNTVGADLSAGALQATGRDLDVAVKGKGWIAVQMADGTEAYTRNGSLQLSQNGILQTSTGQTLAC
jgi:flagellar basal-body rod protein FlgF